MNHRIKLTLNLSSVVIFDPVVLDKYFIQNNLTSADISEYREDQLQINHKVMTEGIVLPI